ncbi:MAG: hypothetical protein ACI4Q4_00855 [Oscillospiraceae bacterium]
MADNTVKSILERFTALNEEYTAIENESKTALKEYTDYCDSSDADLSKKLAEIREKIAKTEEYMAFAKQHATDVEEATMAFVDMELYELEDYKHQVDESSANDYHAETLYTKASGMKLALQEEIERTNKKIGGSKVQAKRLYDSQLADFTARKEKNLEALREFTSGEEFKGYLHHLTQDAAAFNSSGKSELPENPEISLGQRRVRLPVPAEFDEELSLATGGVFNSAAKTIGVPYSVDFCGGKCVYIDYEPRSETYLLGGIQRLLTNVLKYYEHSIKGIFFADPVKYSIDSLGHIAALARGVNPIIDPIAGNSGELLTRLKEFKAKLEPVEENTISHVFVFHSFPECYDGELRAEVLDLINNAAKYKIAVVLTHKVTDAAPSPSDAAAENTVRNASEAIRARNGGFYVEATRDTLFWYSAPSDIPDDVRRAFIEVRRRADVAPAAETSPAVQENAAPAAQESAPAETTAQPEVQPEEPAAQTQPEEPEKPLYDMTKTVPTITYGTDINGKVLSFSFEGFGSSAFVCGTKAAGRNDFIRNIIDTYIKTRHPDTTELWLIDFGGDSFGLYAEPLVPHVKYLMLGGGEQLAESVIDRLCELVDARTAAFAGKWASFADVPADEDMPEVLCVVDGFEVMNRAIAEKPAYGEKLRSVLERCRTFGIRVILAGDTYTTGGNVPAYLAGVLDFAVAMRSEDPAPTSIFNDIQLSAEDIIAIASIPLHHAFIKLPAGSGSRLKFAKLDSAAPEDEIKSVISAAAAMEVSETPDPSGFYRTKRDSLVKYIARSMCFDNVVDEIEKQIAQKTDGAMFFLGSTGTLAPDHPCVLERKFGSSMLLESAPEKEATAADIVISAVRSAKMQKMDVTILSSDAAELLPLTAGRLGEEAITDFAAVCKKITDIHDLVLNEKGSDSLVVILGTELLLDEMATMGTAQFPDGRRNAAQDLIFAISQGAKQGVHFLVQLTEDDGSEQTALLRKTLRCVVTTDENGSRFTSHSRTDTFTAYNHK